MNPRRATIERTTRETRVACSLALETSELREPQIDIRTGIGFLDHLLYGLVFHAGFELALTCAGDLTVDDHHSAEDCALVLGGALDRALEDRAGIARFGSAYAPLDEALARAVVDFSGRPFAAIDLGLRRERLGELACENVAHVLRSFATAGRFTLHVDVLRGENDHHRAEAAFKATALALRQAVVRSASGRIPSTKGALVDSTEAP